MTKPMYQWTGHDLEAAAAAGTDPNALLHLAAMVERGWRGLAANPARALDIERHAASMGNPRAMRLIGDRYHSGNGLEENEALAVTWWRNAANAGDLDAMSNLITLMQSHDPQAVAEGHHWCRMAAGRGHPYAINELKRLETGAAPVTMADFAKMSLEEMAAAAPPDVEDGMSWSSSEVKANVNQINDLVGIWIERLRAHWWDLRSTAQVNGEDVDFPGPDVRALPRDVVDDSSGIELALHAGPYHLQLDASSWDDGWNLELTSFWPHPPADGRAWVVGELKATAQQLGLRLPG